MLQVGSRLGPYVVGKPLGKGGMGTVYDARDSRSGTRVALKVLEERFLSGANDVSRAFVDWLRPLVGKLPRMGRLSDFPAAR